MPMSVLRCLRKSCEETGWLTIFFEFEYKANSFIVGLNYIDKNYPAFKKVQYYYFEATFFKNSDMCDSLHAYVNSKRIGENTGGTKELREFFDIPYGDGTFFRDFEDLYRVIGENIPLKATGFQNEYSNAIRSMSKYVDNPEAVYCCSIILYGENDKRRTSKQSEKIFLLKPQIFELIKLEPRINLGFTDDPLREKGDIEILRGIAERQQRF